MNLPATVSCKACKRPLYWAETVNKKAAPIDATPTPDGNVLLFLRADGSLRCEVLGKDAPRPPGQPLRTNHFQTCPNRDRFRKAAERGTGT